MKDKEKQIQEIEDFFNDVYMTISSNLNERIKVSKSGLNRVYAEAYYNAGYRKIGDDEVVISKEEYDKLLKIKESAEHSFEWIQGYEDGKKAGTKETAKEIFKKIALIIPAFGYEKLSEVEKRLVDDSDFYYKERIEEIFEEYGVEVNDEREMDTSKME